MTICDTIWRDVEEEHYYLEKYPEEEVLVLTDICLRLARAKEIQFERPPINCPGFPKHEWRLTTANEKAIKFCFIGGY